jgi:hypothetical protein
MLEIKDTYGGYINEFSDQGIGESPADEDYRDSSGNVKDYRYRPSSYTTTKMDMEELLQMDKYAAQLYRIPDGGVMETYAVPLPQESRALDVQAQIELGVTPVLARLKDLVQEFCAEDLTDLDTHLTMRRGYMLSILSLVCDRKIIVEGKVYLDFYCPGYNPLKQQCYDSGYNEPEIEDYDSDGELRNQNPLLDRFKVSREQLKVFMHYWSAGYRQGISSIVRKSLYDQIEVKFDDVSFIRAHRIDSARGPGHCDSGQGKIFLSCLKTFEGLEPGRITVLVLGSASHPIKSGYTYHALARFLTLSGLSGVMHLFDPSEQHVSCFVGNFEMVYFPQVFFVGTTYKMEGKDPTVILDDIFTERGQILEDIDPGFSLVTAHSTSRICMKHQSKSVCPRVHSQVMETQYEYYGNEKRIYYRCANNHNNYSNYHWDGKLGVSAPGNQKCALCWFFASCINRIGAPQEDLRPYWAILYSVIGVHCEPVAGIRNIMYLNVLRHELLRGRSIEDAKINLMDNQFAGREVTWNALTRLVEFGRKIDPIFKNAKEKHYPPTHDEEMAIREQIGVNEIVHHLAVQVPNFSLIKSEDYSNEKFERILALYSEREKRGLEVDLTVYRSFPVSCLDVVVYIEDLNFRGWDDFLPLFQEGNQGIMIRDVKWEEMQLYFDRGKLEENDYLDDDI